MPVISMDNVATNGIKFVIDNHDTPLVLHEISNDQEEANDILRRPDPVMLL